MKRLIVLFLACFSAFFYIAFLSLTYIYAQTSGVSDATEIGKQIKVSGSISKDPLGIKMKINEYGSAFIEITNNSPEDLNIGDDMLFWADATPNFNVGLLMPSHNSMPEYELSRLVYAYGVNNLSIITTGEVLWAFGPGGDWLHLQGLGKDYTGTWPKSLSSGAKITIKHRLATWPGSDRGWLSTPVFASSNGIKFRILAQFGQPESREGIVVPLDSETFEQIIRYDKYPVAVRIWAACWLASSKSEKDWKNVAKMLSNQMLSLELRKGLPKILSTQAPAEALDSVNNVLWDATIPEDLQLNCFYSFTWSAHPEAKKLIEKATTHPNKRVNDEAKKYMSKQK